MVGVAVVIALSVLCMSADQSDLPQYSIGPWSALFRLFSVLFAQPHAGVCGDRYIQRSTKFSACVPGKSFSFNMFSVSATRSWFARPSLGPWHARRRPVEPCARCGPNAEANRALCVILNACTVFRQTPPCLACALASHAWGRRRGDDAMTSIRSPQFAIDTGPDQRTRTIRPSVCVLRGLTASATWSKDRVRCTWLRRRCEATLNRRSASLCPFGATIVGTYPAPRGAEVDTSVKEVNLPPGHTRPATTERSPAT